MNLDRTATFTRYLGLALGLASSMRSPLSIYLLACGVLSLIVSFTIQFLFLPRPEFYNLKKFATFNYWVSNVNQFLKLVVFLVIGYVMCFGIALKIRNSKNRNTQDFISKQKSEIAHRHGS